MSKADEIIDAMSNPSGRRYGGAKVWFELIKEQNGRKTDEEGRAIYEFIEAIYIQHPGESVPNVKRAKKADIAAYPAEYKLFKDGHPPCPVEGTPLSEWSMIPRSLATELEYNGIFTLEQLADLPEQYGHVYAKMGPAQEWCGKAKDELDRSKKRSTTTKIKAENKKLKAELEAVKKEVQWLSTRLEMEQGKDGLNNIGDSSASS